MAEPTDAAVGVEEATAKDAPVWLDAAQADAWATGFNAARERFAPILAEKERVIREMAMQALADDQQLTEALDRALAAKAALAGERERCAKVLEPFDDALGEDDEGYGDGLTVVMKWGACSDYSVTLADLRDVRKLAAAIRAQGE